MGASAGRCFCARVAAAWRRTSAAVLMFAVPPMASMITSRVGIKAGSHWSGSLISPTTGMTTEREILGESPLWSENGDEGTYFLLERRLDIGHLSSYRR